MIALAGLAGGAILGAVTARNRAGNRLDMLQYAAGYGIAGALLGVVLSVVILRLS